MNSLYVVTNGYMSCSYVRCYVWAASREEAERMGAEAYRKAGKPSDRLEVALLFAADAPPFATEPNDEDFPLPEPTQPTG